MEHAATLSDQARQLYERRAYRELADLLGQVAPDALRHTPQLGFWLADAWRRLGQTQAALDLTKNLAAPARRSGIERLEQDRLNLEGMLRFESGDVPGAEQCWSELLAHASAGGSTEFVARANNNLGIIYTLQARATEAVACYERAVTAYRLLGLRRGIAQSHQNLGITYRELGLAEDADEHFDSALRYAREDGSDDEMARAENERALLIYLARRDARMARATAQRALRRFTALSDPLGVADTQRVLATIALGDNDLVTARALTDQALHQARASGHRLLEAELLEVQAGIHLRVGDRAAADQLRATADQLFRDLNAPAWGAAFRARIAALIES